jgi:hypothetical protein
MKCIEFPEQTRVLLAPPGVSDEECGTLPVFNDGKECISKWELNEEDKKHIAEKGYIWLRIWGGVTQPPCCLEAKETVFEKPEEEE